MYAVSILGHFGFKKVALDGQTIKTKIVANELSKIYGQDQVRLYDTSGGARFLLRLPFICMRMLCTSRNIIIMPAQKGIHIIPQVLLFFNMLFRRHICYVVIGGWLPGMVRKYRILRRTLRRVDNIYIETESMACSLREMSFVNVAVMPNFKDISIASEKDFPEFGKQPYPLCTFSRVCKTKGIEDAIEAVKRCNTEMGRIVFTLDIYGQIENVEWFEKLMETQPDEIKYRGMIPFSKSTNTLKRYFALLFPTYYPGEGFAGTILDAFSAGIPVIASNWHANGEIVQNDTTGFLFPANNTDALTKILIKIAECPDCIINMKKHCLKKAEKYKPDNIIRVLVDGFK